MRVMEELIVEEDLEDELQARLIEETGNTIFWLGQHDESDGMDESSDHGDPEAEAITRADALQQESADRRGFLTAVAGALESRRVLTDLERSRMQLEDLRGQQLRDLSP